MRKDLDLLRTGLDVLQEAALHGNVTVIVIDEGGRSMTGDLPTLLVKMDDALGRVEALIG